MIVARGLGSPRALVASFGFGLRGLYVLAELPLAWDLFHVVFPTDKPPHVRLFVAAELRRIMVEPTRR